MATRLTKTIAAATLSSFAIAPIAIASMVLATNSAIAKSTKADNGGGSNGNSGKSSNFPGNSGSHGNADKDKVKNLHGRHASELKNLNAVHSLKNGQGYLHASANSNVGQIAALKAVVSETTWAKNDLQNAQDDLAAHLEENPELTEEEIQGLIAKTHPESESYDPGYKLTDLEAKTLDLIEKVESAQTNFDDMIKSFDEALLAASNGRVLSEGALDYYKSKLGF